MPFDSNGVFSRVMNWTSDQQNGIAIECGRHDAEDDNFAEGFNKTFCRDGRAAATGNFNLGNHKIQNLAAGTATTDAVNKGQLDGVYGNCVHKTGNETISGTKTFSSTIHGSINGNAATVTNGVYTTGNQTIGGTKTFSAVAYGKASDVIDSIVTTTAIRKTAQSGDNASWAVKFGNGFIIQGGFIESDIYTVTLAIPFTKESYQVSLVQAVDSEHNVNPTVSDKTVTNFKCGHHGWRVSWIAAGF